MVVLPGWSPANERTFKQILYRFLEEVQVTKAALYLRAPGGVFVLATQYGFGRRDLLAAEHGVDEPLTRKALERRHEPWVLNRPDGFPEVAGYLTAGGTGRLLLVPLFDGLRTVGFVDARDKGRRRPFEDGDVRRARTIADAMLAELQACGLADDPRLEQSSADETAEPRAGRPRAAASSTADLPGDAVAPAALSERSAAMVADAARSAVREPGVVATAVTVVTPARAAGVLWVRDDVAELDAVAIHRHQYRCWRAAGRDTVHPSDWGLSRLAVPSSGGRARPQAIATDRVVADADWALLLSVVAEAAGDAHRALSRLQQLAAALVEVERLRFARRQMARRLLEPGESRLDALVAHSREVSRLSFGMAVRLGWDAGEAERAALAGLLHDVGMRELDYERLYREPTPGAEEQRTYRRHVEVGERILRGSGLDELGAVVRHHHERWDGRGYPDRLAGDRIPAASRVVHLAEVYDTLTSATSYRPAVAPERALTVIRAAAGQQFDPELVPVLAELVS